MDVEEVAAATETTEHPEDEKHVEPKENEQPSAEVTILDAKVVFYEELQCAGKTIELTTKYGR